MTHTDLNGPQNEVTTVDVPEDARPYKGKHLHVVKTGIVNFYGIEFVEGGTVPEQIAGLYTDEFTATKALDSFLQAIANEEAAKPKNLKQKVKAEREKRLDGIFKKKEAEEKEEG